MGPVESHETFIHKRSFAFHYRLLRISVRNSLFRNVAEEFRVDDHRGGYSNNCARMVMSDFCYTFYLQENLYPQPRLNCDAVNASSEYKIFASKLDLLLKVATGTLLQKFFPML